MNERIRELAEQAGLEPCIIFKNYAVSEKSITIEQEKFAELIVRECIEIVDKWSYDGPYREEGDIIPVKKIKEHFGVEE